MRSTRLPVPVRGQVSEQVAGLVDDLVVALAARPGCVQVLEPFGVQAGGGHAVESAVVAFPQPAVGLNRGAGVAEGDVCGLDGAGEVGDQYGGEVVVTAAPAEFGGESPALVGQPPGKPAGRDPGR